MKFFKKLRDQFLRDRNKLTAQAWAQQQNEEIKIKYLEAMNDRDWAQARADYHMKAHARMEAMSAGLPLRLHDADSGVAHAFVKSRKEG